MLLKLLTYPLLLWTSMRKGLWEENFHTINKATNSPHFHSQHKFNMIWKGISSFLNTLPQTQTMRTLDHLCSPPPSSPYLTEITCLQRWSLSNPNLHNHYSNKVWLNILRFPNPQRSFFSGEQIIPQFTFPEWLFKAQIRYDVLPFLTCFEPKICPTCYFISNLHPTPFPAFSTINP